MREIRMSVLPGWLPCHASVSEGSWRMQVGRHAFERVGSPVERVVALTAPPHRFALLHKGANALNAVFAA
jgi:hypothetical protein